MRFKQTILAVCLLICILFSVSAVCASSIGETQNESDNILASSDTQIIGENEELTGERDNGTFQALQDKITNAQANSTITLENDYNNTGGFTASGIKINKTLTIDGKGHIIDANYNGRVFNIAKDPYGSGISVTLKNIIFINSKYSYDGGVIQFDSGYYNSIINCSFINNTCEDNGGVIYASGFSYSTIYKCLFVNNTSKRVLGGGGAICLYRCENNNISDCKFINNTAYANGGAISWNTGSTSISNCDFINNTASSGGAIRFENMENTNISDCNFINNYANSYDGGAIYFGGSGIISNSYFENNTASRYGGAVYMGTVKNSRFINNSAEYGGALYETSASNCQFINNSASEEGGALYKGDITNCTFENNKVNGEVNDYILDPKIRAGDFTSTYNSDEKFFATFTDSKGNVVTDINITLAIYKNMDLIAAYSSLITEGFSVKVDAGTYFGVLIVNDERYGNYNTYITLSIKQASSKLTLSNLVAVYGTNNNVVITLKDNDGNALSDVQVSVNFNGVKNLKTDKNGQIKISADKLIPKTYTISATFAGNSNYIKSAASGKVTVKKADVKITAKTKTFKKSLKVKKYTITLKSGSTALNKVKVTIKIKGKTFTAKTNSKGKATFKIKKFTKKGTHKSKITFTGNKYYNKVTKTVKIKIK